MKEGLIFKQIPLVMRKMKAIEKTQQARGSGGGYNFRGIDDIYNTLHDILAECEVFSYPKRVENLTTEQIESARGTKGFRIVNHYTYVFQASDGSFLELESVGEAIDYGDKAHNKCASISHKYAFLQLFAIPTEDTLKDPDATTHAISAISKTPEELERLVSICEGKARLVKDESLGGTIMDTIEKAKHDYNMLVKVENRIDQILTKQREK